MGSIVGVQPCDGFRMFGTDIKIGTPNDWQLLVWVKTMTERR